VAEGATAFRNITSAILLSHARNFWYKEHVGVEHAHGEWLQPFVDRLRTRCDALNGVSRRTRLFQYATSTRRRFPVGASMMSIATLLGVFAEV
jgi:hypothetical protein